MGNRTPGAVNRQWRRLQFALSGAHRALGLDRAALSIFLSGAFQNLWRLFECSGVGGTRGQQPMFGADVHSALSDRRRNLRRDGSRALDRMDLGAPALRDVLGDSFRLGDQFRHANASDSVSARAPIGERKFLAPMAAIWLGLGAPA